MNTPYSVRIYAQGRVDWVHCESETVAYRVAKAVSTREQCEVTVWLPSRGNKERYVAYLNGEVVESTIGG